MAARAHECVYIQLVIVGTSETFDQFFFKPVCLIFLLLILLIKQKKTHFLFHLCVFVIEKHVCVCFVTRGGVFRTNLWFFSVSVRSSSLVLIWQTCVLESRDATAPLFSVFSQLMSWFVQLLRRPNWTVSADAAVKWPSLQKYYLI